MQDVKYSTENEKNMFCDIQRKIGAYANGYIGTQTMSDLAIILGATNHFPVTLEMYKCPVIIAKDIVVCDPDSSIRQYKNSISGSFTYPSAKAPCSILINQGKDIFSTSCHAFLDKPEGVIARYNDGSYWQGRCKSTSDIPNRANVRWAIGGMTLGKNYSPATEGFSGKYADVLRQTNHTVIGIKNKMCYLVYTANMTGGQIQTLVKDKMQFEMALLLDGGHIAAINGTEPFAQINLDQYQGYMIQGI